MGALTIRFSPTLFAYAAAVLATLSYVARGVATTTRNVRNMLRDLRRLRVDVALLKRAQGVRLSHSERQLLDSEGE